MCAHVTLSFSLRGGILTGCPCRHSAARTRGSCSQSASSPSRAARRTCRCTVSIQACMHGLAHIQPCTHRHAQAQAHVHVGRHIQACTRACMHPHAQARARARTHTCTCTHGDTPLRLDAIAVDVAAVCRAEVDEVGPDELALTPLAVLVGLGLLRHAELQHAVLRSGGGGGRSARKAAPAPSSPPSLPAAFAPASAPSLSSSVRPRPSLRPSPS